MNHSRIARSICTAICAISFIMLAGCGGDTPSKPRNAAAPSFENIWPAAVGNHWTYDVVTGTVAGSTTLYATASEVPPIPEMESLYASLASMPIGSAVSPEHGTFHLRFAEDMSPSLDILTMRLANETIDISGSPNPPTPLSAGLFWIRSSNRIAYSLGGQTGWVLLDESLAAGHQFVLTYSVTTELATRIWRTLAYTALGTEYSNCIECFYVLDMGVRRVGTAEETQGYYREYSYGVVVYAPELGPVYCHEMNMMGRGVWDNREAAITGFVNDAARSVPY